MTPLYWWAWWWTLWLQAANAPAGVVIEVDFQRGVVTGRWS